MPYKDPEKQRAYKREWMRMRRAGESGTQSRTPSGTLIPVPVRIQTAKDILALLAEQLAAVRADPEAGALQKARTIGYLAGIALKAVEIADLTARVEELERILKERVKDESA